MNVLEHMTRVSDIAEANYTWTQESDSLQRYDFVKARKKVVLLIQGGSFSCELRFVDGGRYAATVILSFAKPDERILEHTLSLALSWLTGTQVIAFSYIAVGERFGYEGRSLMRIKQLPAKMGANAIDEETGDLRLIKDDWRVQALDRLA